MRDDDYATFNASLIYILCFDTLKTSIRPVKSCTSDLQMLFIIEILRDPA